MITWRFPLLSPSLPSSQLYCETDPLLQHMFSTTWDASKALLSHLLRLTINSVFLAPPPPPQGAALAGNDLNDSYQSSFSASTPVFLLMYTIAASPCLFSGVACVSLGGNRSQHARGSEEGSAVSVCGRRLPGRISVTENWLTWASGAQTSRQSFQRAALGGHTGLPTFDVAMPLYLLVFTGLQRRKPASRLLCANGHRLNLPGEVIPAL